MSAVRPRQCGSLPTTWTCVVFLALCSASFGRVIGPSYQVVSRIRRAIDDNDISQDTNSVLWKPGDLDIVSDKLSIYQDSNGDFKATEVNLESDNPDGALESTFTVDLKPQGSNNVANEQKIVYSYPYVGFRQIGDDKKVAGDEDPIKDGSSYIIYGDYKEHTEPLEELPNVNSHSVSGKTEGEKVFGDILHNFFKFITRTPNGESTPSKRSDGNEVSNALMITLSAATKLLTNLNDMHKNIGSSSKDSINSGTFLNGFYREPKSPVGGDWSPLGRKSVSGPSDDVSKVDRLLASMLADTVEGAVGRKLSRTSGTSSRCPFAAQREYPSGTQYSAGLMSPELLWLITMM